MNQENPLVSIIVITYNSAKYVLETLESAKVQTYQNIELIVSDDCSTDDTVEICREWIEEHKERFVRTELITVDKNTGIAPNCNRGLYAAQGEWIKLIAGDDLLLPQAIETYITAATQKPDVSFFFAKVKTFGDSKVSTHTIDFWDSHYNLFYKLDTPKKQYRFIKNYYNFIPAAAGFIKTKAIKNLGCFDEDIPFLEDYPMWLNAIRNGYHLTLLNETLVMYRASNDSIQTNPKFSLSGLIFIQKHILKNPLYKILGKSINTLDPSAKNNKVLIPLLKLSSYPLKVFRKIKKLYLKNNYL